MPSKVRSSHVEEYEYTKEELLKCLGIQIDDPKKINYIDLTTIGVGMDTKYRVDVKVGDC